jgi:hypothetical protein
VKRSNAAVVAIVLVVLAGVAMRVFVLTHSLGVLDSDEATTGLVARHFLHNFHEHPVFYWASNYGGTIEAAVTAPFFAVFGATPLVLKSVAIGWYAVGCVLLWRVGRRLVPEPMAVLAALLAWVWPGVYLWWSTKSRGFYGSLLVFGLLMALMGLRAVERPERRVEWLVFGLAAGLGWWDNPQIVLIAVPALLWVAIKNWRALRNAWLAIPTAVLGAGPWIVWNIRHPLESFDVPPQGPGYSYLTAFHRFWTQGLPVALGLRLPYSLRWLFPHAWLAYLAIGALSIYGLIRLGWRPALPLAAGFIAYPLLFARNPLAFTTSEGRYVFLLLPVLALCIATWGRNPVTAVAVIVGAIALSIGGLSAMHDGNSPFASDKPVPVHMGPLVAALRQERVAVANADYWIAYRLDFESQETVTVVGVPYNRYQPYADRARSVSRPAWIFVAGSSADKDFAASHADYRLRPAGGFSVYVPS